MLTALITWSALVGCAPSEAPPAPQTESVVVASAWSRELAQVDGDIAAARARLTARPGQWLIEQQLAGLTTQRARLSGDYADYASAEDAIARAFASAPAGSGPFMGRARLNMTLHRLDRVEADLDAAERKLLLSDRDREAIGLVRVSLAIERGQYDVAEQTLQAIPDSGSLSLHAVRSNLAWKTGDHPLAHRELDLAAARYHGQSAEPRAWFHLLHGLMALDAENLDEALVHYTAAADALPGYWLVDEHVAEVYALQGRSADALAIYERVVAQTGSPELMGAMAGVLQDLDRPDEAAKWIAAAKQGFDTQLARFPEAAAGHALDFQLEHGEPERALALAEANATLRPNPESLDQLARARAGVAR